MQPGLDTPQFQDGRETCKVRGLPHVQHRAVMVSEGYLGVLAAFFKDRDPHSGFEALLSCFVVLLEGPALPLSGDMTWSCNISKATFLTRYRFIRSSLINPCSFPRPFHEALLNSLCETSPPLKQKVSKSINHQPESPRSSW